MDNRSTGLFNDSRVNLRVEDNSDILWKGSDGKTEGRGKVRNISTSGMLIETKTDCVPDNDSILYFDSISQNGSYIPKASRLVWHRKKRFSNKYEYGIKFIEPSENVLSNLRQKVQKSIHHFTSVRRVETILNILIVCVIVGLTCYAIWMNTTITDNMYESNQKMSFSMAKQTALTNNFSELYKVTDVQLQSSEAHLARVSAELDAKTEALAVLQGQYQEGQNLLQNVSSELDRTRKILSDAQALLAQNRTDFDNDIEKLSIRNDELIAQMRVLQSKLNYYEGDIKSLDQGNGLISLYRVKMKLVQSKIKVFKKEAEVVRKAAMAEQDRIRMMIGNNGYLVKSGTVVNTDMEKFHAAQVETPTSSSAKDIRVDVTMVE